MNVFPSNSNVPPLGPSFIAFSDPTCRSKAAVFDLFGHPLPGSQVSAPGGVISQFLSAATVLYARDTAGQVETLYPHVAATQPIVTGSKGANAALTSLVQALAAVGLIVDQTT